MRTGPMRTAKDTELEDDSMPAVDLAFRLTGRTIPADHGYLLYCALCERFPSLHLGGDGRALAGRAGGSQDLWRAVAVHPINGRLSGERQLSLTGRSRLTLRIDSGLVPEFLTLAGEKLALGGGEIRVGVPQSFALRPKARLRSRLVTIKGFLEPEPFLEAVRRQLDGLRIRGVPGLLKRRGIRSLEGRSGESEDRCPFVRRTVRIKDKEVVGYAVEVSGLDAEESIRLQEAGIGGRRRFGCGVFVPARG